MLESLALALCFVFAPQSPSTDGKEPSVFDGKTLAGWDGAPGVWSVKDGCIVGSSMASQIERNTFLIWQGGELTDFIFECEVRVEGDNNSGIQYRSERPDAKSFTVIGYQLDVHSEPTYLGQLYEEGGRGILALCGQQIVCNSEGSPRVIGKLAEPSPKKLAEWHRYKVTARGTKLVHEVDGVVTMECDDQYAKARRAGVLALQVHAGVPMRVSFRELKLQRLPTVEIAKVAPESAAKPQWIWDEKAEDGEELFFRHAFTLAAAPKAGRLAISCDNHCRVFLNGQRIGQSDTWEAPLLVDVQKQLQSGENLLAVHGWNEGTIAGLCVQMRWESVDGKRGVVVSDATWRCNSDDPDGWDRVGFNDASWATARAVALLGEQGAPWSASLDAGSFDGAEIEDGLGAPQPASELTLAKGWTAQRLMRVPRSMGSWVSLAKDPNGRLYASDQGAGLYRLTLGADFSVTAIERVEVDLDGCHGLLWAHDCLYAVVNGNRSGLYRLTDSNGDDRLDRVELLRTLEGEGEHGPHSISLDVDREHLLVLCGNHTKLPKLANSRLPLNWGEDLLLPRIDDPNGHAVGVMAPGGYLCRIDRDGKDWELITAGFRNAFDFSVASNGEIYAYDADMEYDMGLPWYRPTRICHCVSGADFGWRNGSGKWPADYPDSLPPVCDIGPGSPTGLVTTGRGMFCLDWTFGTLYEVTPSNSGATAVAAPRQIASGQPWPLTDAVQVPGSDSLYVLTGGRGLPSSLYLLNPPKDSPRANNSPVAAELALRAQRHSLEAFHGRADAKAVAAAFPALGSNDAFVRHAARIAIEWQPVAEWRAAALAERSSTWASLTALLALARQGNASDLQPLLVALARIPFAQMDLLQQVAWARIHALAFIRLGKPELEVRTRTVAMLLALFPTGRDRIDQELCALLCALDESAVVEKAMPLLLRTDVTKPPPWAEVVTRNPNYGGQIVRMMREMPPAPQLQLAFSLRNVAHGWTLEQRESYFTFLAAARKKVGNASYGGYLGRIWQDSMAGCTVAERVALAPVAGEKIPVPPPFRATPPKGPGRDWQLAEAAALVKGGLVGRDFQRGRNLYFATSCAVCHRFAGEGGNVGPDLSSLSNKFGAADVLEAILQPSKVVSDQYAGMVLKKTDGSTEFGRFVRSKVDGKDVYTGIKATAEAQRITVPFAEVASVEPSKLSLMPAGLISPLNEAELCDLIAFLLSRGDEQGPMFAR